eukprot:10712715-Karenia_brevis.AAC.1
MSTGDAWSAVDWESASSNKSKKTGDAWPAVVRCAGDAWLAVNCCPNKSVKSPHCVCKVSTCAINS